MPPNELARRGAQLQERTQQLAQALTASGYSARDAGPLLGISHQRVSQVARGTLAQLAAASAKVAGRASRTARGEHTKASA